MFYSAGDIVACEKLAVMLKLVCHSDMDSRITVMIVGNEGNSQNQTKELRSKVGTNVHTLHMVI